MTAVPDNVGWNLSSTTHELCNLENVQNVSMPQLLMYEL